MNHTLAHHIYAGADMFLMPSMFEPCGLSQMISMRYGTLPVVRETGGLRDTVLSYNEFSGAGNGFTFLNYNAHDMLHVLERAVELYKNHPDEWKKLMERAMRGQYGWDQSAHHYVDLYKELAKPARKPKAPKEAPAAPEASQEPATEEPASVDPVIVIAMSAETAAQAVETPAPESPAKPAKKPRAKKNVEPAPEAVAETPKPAKKPRAKKTKE